ncbi:prolyl oligopeptidase family serine peptidase [Aureimonas phyllosphaerae]
MPDRRLTPFSQSRENGRPRMRLGRCRLARRPASRKVSHLAARWLRSAEAASSQAADILAERGIAALRIDFRGSGTSGGKFEDMTVESDIDDALGALACLKENADVDGRRIAVPGKSLGGIVSSAVAGRAGNGLKPVVLWNRGINAPAAFDTIFGLGGMRRRLVAT